jgi:hypothetical protein
VHALHTPALEPPHAYLNCPFGQVASHVVQADKPLEEAKVSMPPTVGAHAVQAAIPVEAAIFPGAHRVQTVEPAGADDPVEHTVHVVGLSAVLPDLPALHWVLHAGLTVPETNCLFVSLGAGQVLGVHTPEIRVRSASHVKGQVASLRATVTPAV